MRKRIRFMKFSRRRVWRRVNRALEEMRLIERGRNCFKKDHRERVRDGSRRRGLRLAGTGAAGILSVAAGVLAVLHILLVKKGCHDPSHLLIAVSIQGLLPERNDPLFPSSSALSEAGLSLSDRGDLDLPAFSTVMASSREASQLLTGTRYGRRVRSGIQKSGKGKLLVRTGVSSEPPCFCCRLEAGRMLSCDSPFRVSSILLSGRTGPGDVTIVNDGRWLVIDRLLTDSTHLDTGWLLLRQLRDISLAEMLSVPEEISYLREEGQAHEPSSSRSGRPQVTAGLPAVVH
ncbi:MAG: hypothetical protein JXA64_09845 [Candidatus Fermentibacteraceae bacterium]|nr:hypothetical protein [Candidatus Fermentibacteraceae bacterium]MBN2609401.1 hypothetical protein [Candidatus Fermentibacteraceae bacterium]